MQGIYSNQNWEEHKYKGEKQEKEQIPTNKGTRKIYILDFDNNFAGLYSCLY